MSRDRDPTVDALGVTARVADASDRVALESTGEPALALALPPVHAVLAAALRSPEILRARASAKARLFGATEDLVRVDRFMLLRKLGGGGMGVVYAAYDPELDRKVALKLLRPDAYGDRTGQMQARLVREAQAMAKVTHPNVVTVHQVGTFDGQVYIAMEFVDGVTLTRWLAQEQRSWPEIRRAFLDVGRGLAAAHAAGLVHRDFKPDNVMVSQAERIVVLDFGLAMRRDHVEPDAPRDEVAASHAELGSGMTETGAVLGTPAYMAPEQHRSAKVDARADQFSYCVALFEAVYGRRPFVASTMAELVDAVLEGRIEPPSERGDVPRRAYRALLRGLDRDPERRFATMNELLGELLHDPSVARRRWLTFAGLSAVVVAGIASFEQLGEEPACDAAASKLAAAWSSQLRTRGRESFLGSGKPYAAETWTAVERALDDHATRWRAVHTAVCDAGAAPEDDRLGRLQCLEWRAQEISAVAQLFALADGEVVERALEAVAEIAAPEACSSERALQASARLPDDPTLRRGVLEARAELARAKGLGDAGKARDAIVRIEKLRATPAARDHLPLSAEIDDRLGRLRRRAGDVAGAEEALGSAVYTALAAEQDDLALRAVTELVWIVGSDRVAFDEAMPWVRLGESLEQRLGDDAAGSDLGLAVGSMFAFSGRHAEARAAFRDALARRESLTGPDAPELVPALLVLAASTANAGESAEGLELVERASRIALDTFGADHVETAAVELAHGELAWKLGRYDEARSHFDEALRIEETLRGREHPATAAALVGLARTDAVTGALDDALARLERVGTASREGRIDDAVLVAALEVRAQVLIALGRRSDADAAIDRALAIARRHGAQHPLQAFPLSARAEVHLAAGEPADALRSLEQSRKALGGSLDAHDPRRQEMAVISGRALLATGEQVRGVEVLQRARDALRACCPGHARLREAEAALATAISPPSSTP